jgi:hypothetical protein
MLVKVTPGGHLNKKSSKWDPETVAVLADGR